MTVLSFSGSPPVIDVLVQPSVGYQQAMRAVGQSIPSVPVRLLVDTGASHTAIDYDELRKLGIPASGTTWARTMTSGALQQAGMPAPQYSKYMVSLLIMCAQPGRSFQVQSLNVTAPNQQPFVGAGYAGLLGRDVLNLGLLMYDGNGAHFALSF